MRPAAELRRSEPDGLAERPLSVAGASARCMVLAAVVRQDVQMATTVTQGEPRELRTSSATSMRWQGKLATFAECQLNGFANCRAVESVASDNGVAIVQLHSVRVEDGLDDVADPSSSVAVGWRPLLQFGAYPLLSRPEPLSGQNLSGDPEQEHFLRRSGRGHHHHPVEVCRASSYRAQFLLRP